MNSKPPRDGQAALDNSFFSNEGRRIAVQDGNFVTLHEHAPGRFHGFVTEASEFHSLPDDVQSAFYTNGLVLNIQTGRMKK